MTRIFVDGTPYNVKDGTNLLEASLTLGLNLPYFCWHPALGSVGACRQCAVKQFRDENDKHGKIVMACMTPAVEGTRISIEDQEVRDFRASIIEGLMINHPHDCPVCDEGGECHLQDMTVMTGHDYRRYRGLKRTFENQNLGPFVNHEMNRCIQCYRCTRFYNDYAGGHDFGPFKLRNLVYFGRAEDGVLESEFSGNLVEVCPTGVFTDKTFKQHFTRKWDLTTAPSICVNCGLGCNTIAGERYGGLRRIRNRYNGEVNGYFICDRGRYGYEFVNSDKRIKSPLSIREGTEEKLSKTEAIRRVAALLSQGRVIGIGSPRASLETNFALRTLVGADNFYMGMNGLEYRLVTLMIAILQDGPVRSASLKDVRQSDAVLVLGEDVTNTAPMLDLSIRQAVLNKPMENVRKLKIHEWDDKAVRELVQDSRGPLFIAYPKATKLDEISEGTYHIPPQEIARLGFAIANAIDASTPEVEGLSEDLTSATNKIAAALRSAQNPVVVSGPGCSNDMVVQAAANVAWALHRQGRPAQLCFTMPEANSFGAVLFGGSKPLDEALDDVRTGSVKTVIIAENDLYRRAKTEKIDALFQSGINVVVLDYLMNQTARRANLLLPAATFAESNGTLVNNEGRAQRFYQVFPAESDVQASWKWIRDIMSAAGLSSDILWEKYDDILAALARTEHAFEDVVNIAPPASFRIAGQKIARQPHRYSGRTSILANVDVSEPKPPDDPDTPFSFTMEGYQEGAHPALIARYWTPGWNSVQALNRFQEEIAGPLRGGDPGVRLIEPNSTSVMRYFQDVPDKSEPRKGEWLIIPLYHIFGSEELSIHTSGVAELAPKPYIAFNPEDARKSTLNEGDYVQINAIEESFVAPVKYETTLPTGAIGVPVGLPGFLTSSAIGKFGKIAKRI
jgi:NADH-quinone oxidoreductase subunit G